MTTATADILPRGRMIDVGDGLQMHFHVVGEGYPVIFIHGSGPGASGWSNFKQNVRAFVDRGYQCVIPDLVGYGFSDKPDTDYTLDFFVETLTEGLRALGIDRCALVGNSMGGTISIRMGVKTPELVERMVLMAPGGLHELDFYRKTPGIVRMLPVLTAPGGLTRDALREVFTYMFHDSSLLNDQLIEERFTVAELQNDAIYKRWFIPSLVDQLGAIEQPVLGLWGTNDQFCPVESSLILIHGLKNARLVMATGCGHWFQVEKQAMFEREVLGFLAE